MSEFIETRLKSSMYVKANCKAIDVASRLLAVAVEKYPTCTFKSRTSTFSYYYFSQYTK